MQKITMLSNIINHVDEFIIKYSKVMSPIILVSLLIS